MGWFRRKGDNYFLTIRQDSNGSKGERKTLVLGNDFKIAKERQASIELALKSNTFRAEALQVLGMEKNGSDGSDSKPVAWNDAKIRVIRHFTEIRKAPGTVRLLAQALREFEAIVSPQTVGDLVPAKIDLFIQKRTQGFWRRKNCLTKKIKKSTVNLECRSLRSAFKKFVRWGWIPKNPFLEADIPTAEKTLPKALDRGTFKKLLKASNKPLRRCIKLLYLSGMRAGELLSMVYADVNNSRSVIHIRAHGEISTKTHSERMVPVEREFFKELGRIGKPDRPIVGMNEIGLQVNKNWLYRSFRRALKRAGLAGYTPHSLRDTYATLLAANEYYPHEIAARLGQTNIQTAMKYVELSRLLFRKAKSKIKYRF